MIKRTCVLAILDGWGIGARHASNPIHVIRPPRIESIRHSYLSGALQASGIAVGLPWGETGNSEVGHLTIGAGKVIYQHYPRITLAIERGDFIKNEALISAFHSAEEKKKTVHCIGLLSQGNVHASFNHLEALIRMAHERGTSSLSLHLITDGKDSPPQSFVPLLEKLRSVMKIYSVGRIASISGRYYAMDRDGRWDRTLHAYSAMTGNGTEIGEGRCDEYAREQYEKSLNDEFIEPAITDRRLGVTDGDSIIFFNFREDSIKQIAESFTKTDFPHFRQTVNPSSLTVITFTDYGNDVKALVAFPPQPVGSTLGEIIAQNGLTQLRIAETKKYAHVTYFINGLREEPFQNEHRVLIPSLRVARDDDAPQMMAHDITSRIVNAIEHGGFDLVIANYANADMIAHTGNYEAAKKAVEVLDAEIGALQDSVLARNGILIITSDHGNIERLYDPATGMPETHHDPNPVPIYIVGNGFERKKTDTEVMDIERGTVGILSDVAPTILEIMNIPKPHDMTGKSLLRSLR